jgi:hypothetical protein
MSDLIQSMPAMAKDSGQADGARERRDSRFTELDIIDEKDNGDSESLKTKNAEHNGDGEPDEPVIKTGADVSKYVLYSLPTVRFNLYIVRFTFTNIHTSPGTQFPRSTPASRLSPSAVLSWAHQWQRCPLLFPRSTSSSPSM